MKSSFDHIVERARKIHPTKGPSPRGAPYGYFEFSNGLRVVVGCGMGWEHVSVSRRGRIPNWEDMHWVKQRFWDDDETVMQLHPSEDRYVNECRYCLHLWRPIGAEIPIPPIELV